MARFRAWIEGRYGNQARRMGDDGVLAELTAAKVGVHVVGRLNDRDQEEFQVFATQGRRAGVEPVYLGVVHVQNGEVRFTVNNAALLAKEDR
jgi:hypothetical protein